jgi:hypothetical protein
VHAFTFLLKAVDSTDVESIQNVAFVPENYQQRNFLSALMLVAAFLEDNGNGSGGRMSNLLLLLTSLFLKRYVGLKRILAKPFAV